MFREPIRPVYDDRDFARVLGLAPLAIPVALLGRVVAPIFAVRLESRSIRDRLGVQLNAKERPDSGKAFSRLRHQRLAGD